MRDWIFSSKKQLPSLMKIKSNYFLLPSQAFHACDGVFFITLSTLPACFPHQYNLQYIAFLAIQQVYTVQICN